MAVAAEGDFPNIGEVKSLPRDAVPVAPAERALVEEGPIVGIALGYLKCVIGLNGVAARETFIDLDLQRIVLIGRATALVLHPLRPAKLLEVGPARIEVRARVAGIPGCLVEIDGVAIADEGVAATVADVSGGNRQVPAKLVLDGGVVHHHQRSRDLARTGTNKYAVGYGEGAVAARGRDRSSGRTLVQRKDTPKGSVRTYALRCQNRGILRDDVAEIGAEDTHRIGPSVTDTHYRLVVDLIGDAQARREIPPVAGHRPMNGNFAHAEDFHHARVEVRKSAVSGFIDILRENHFPAQAVVDLQLAGDAP